MRVGEADCLRPVEAKGAQLGHVGCLEAKARSNVSCIFERLMATLIGRLLKEPCLLRGCDAKLKGHHPCLALCLGMSILPDQRTHSESMSHDLQDQQRVEAAAWEGLTGSN